MGIDGQRIGRLERHWARDDAYHRAKEAIMRMPAAGGLESFCQMINIGLPAADVRAWNDGPIVTARITWRSGRRGIEMKFLGAAAIRMDARDAAADACGRVFFETSYLETAQEKRKES